MIDWPTIQRVTSADGAFDYKPITHAAACDACPTGLLDLDVDEGMAERCSTCGAGDSNCSECGAALTFDAALRGTTCGGHQLVGWRVCACGAAPTLCRRSKSADAVDWRIAKGGRSLTAGGFKVRAEGGGDPGELMARIVRVPELELEVERLRAELAKRKEPCR